MICAYAVIKNYMEDDYEKRVELFTAGFIVPRTDTKEYRLYGWVPYNLSEIQKGIQFGHAAVELMLEAWKDEWDDERAVTMEWAKKHKTFIILNGGPTRAEDQPGGMHQIFRILHMIKLLHIDRTKKVGENSNPRNASEIVKFEEPDLNNALTGVAVVLSNYAFDRSLLTADGLAMVRRVIAKDLGGSWPFSLQGYTESDRKDFDDIANYIGYWNLAMQAILPYYSLA